jgi:hypothetical protein
MDLHSCLQTLNTFGPFEDFREVTLGLLDFLTQPPIIPPEQEVPKNISAKYPKIPIELGLEAAFQPP